MAKANIQKGRFQVRDEFQPTKFETGGIIFFFSRNLYENKNYIVGMYAKAEYTGNTGFSNIEAPTKYCLKLYKYLEFNKERYLPNGRIRIPQVNFTYITEKNAKNILKDALSINSTVSGIEDDSNPRSDFLKLAHISKLYIKDITIPKLQIKNDDLITFGDFIKKEFPNFSSDDRIIITKNNDKLKRSYIRHQDLINRAIDLLKEKKWRRFKISSNADILATKGQRILILEAKSITAENTKSQIRNAVSQLYQYSYELNIKGYKKHKLVLLLEKCPEDYWFSFCKYCNIELWYKENKVIIYKN
ncbi:MAG: hypothetical protein ACYDA4_04170 [Ignavibacteriaceae bacterium]